MRAYHERVHCDPPLEPGRRFGVPTGVAMPRAEPGFPPRRAPRSMIEETALRLSGVHDTIEFLAPIVIAGERHRGLVSELLASSGVAPAARRESRQARS